MEHIQEKYNLISAEVVADSLNQFGERLTTMKLVFPRIILAEFNTHRMFNRNSASSRAIPFKKTVKMVQEQPFIPIAWQKEHIGMQGYEYFDNEDIINTLEDQWLRARDYAVEQARVLNRNINYPAREGVTKQLCNRLLEPFMYHTVLVTATEWENFFELRCPKYHKPYETIYYRSKKDLLNSLPDVDAKIIKKESTNIDWLQRNKGAAEIHIMDLAEKMWDAYNESTPKQLEAGQWHIPFKEFNVPKKENAYIDWEAEYLQELIYKQYKRLPTAQELVKYSIQTRIKIATARCARLSYETLGDNPEINYEKDIKLHDDLLAMGHFSPFEHCCVVPSEQEYNEARKGKEIGWFYNLKGFKSYRFSLDNPS